jgi:hypothetical protein
MCLVEGKCKKYFLGSKSRQMSMNRIWWQRRERRQWYAHTTGSGALLWNSCTTWEKELCCTQLLSGKLFQDAILTMDNMRKINWLGSPICSFCNENETANHLFFVCSSAKSVWGILGSTLDTSLCPSFVSKSFVWLYVFYPREKSFIFCCWRLFGMWEIKSLLTI